MMEIFDSASCGVSPHRRFPLRLHESMVTKSMKTYPVVGGKKMASEGPNRRQIRPNNGACVLC